MRDLGGYELPGNNPSSSQAMSTTPTDEMFKLPDFMAPPNDRKTDDQRPRPLQGSKSWSRIEPESPGRRARKQRASTVDNGAVSKLDNAETPDQPGAVSQDPPKMQPDAFEKSSDEDGHHEAVEGIAGRLSVDCDDLPIELISLTDRSVRSSFESLSADSTIAL
jgi:hypothetical protein